MTAPGWFPDPSDPTRLRYFDGKVWTERYANVGGPLPSVVEPEKTGTSGAIKVGVAVGAGIAVLIVLSSLGNSGKSSYSPSDTNAGGLISAPTTKSGFTPGQDNAIEKAKLYLNFAGFSKGGLINQLEMGDKFSEADATFAVEHIEASGGVDWNEQAVKKAKTYLSFSGFSLDGLINQLEMGDKFTPAQAEYGANKAYGG